MLIILKVKVCFFVIVILWNGLFSYRVVMFKSLYINLLIKEELEVILVKNGVNLWFVREVIVVVKSVINVKFVLF